ncbi:hypothetical protein [Aeromonas sp. 1HA1]|uniref:hypothetical protein n=1 Tax=Aeromonas sp. 1HA1 TaxID=2699193 RepID=UPI0031F54747
MYSTRPASIRRDGCIVRLAPSSMMMVRDLVQQAWHLEEKIRREGAGQCEAELADFRALLQQIVDELTGLFARS